jgi:hypothetical protein
VARETAEHVPVNTLRHALDGRLDSGLPEGR